MYSRYILNSPQSYILHDGPFGGGVGWRVNWWGMNRWGMVTRVEDFGVCVRCSTVPCLWFPDETKKPHFHHKCMLTVKTNLKNRVFSYFHFQILNVLLNVSEHFF